MWCHSKWWIVDIFSPTVHIIFSFCTLLGEFSGKSMCQLYTILFEFNSKHNFSVSSAVNSVKMQLDVGNEPYLSKQKYHANLVTWIFPRVQSGTRTTMYQMDTFTVWYGLLWWPWKYFDNAASISKSAIVVPALPSEWIVIWQKLHVD